MSTRTPDFGARYEGVTALSRGGMSRVYHAVDRLRGESVALKLLDPEAGAPAELLAAEFRYIASLHHPGIVRVYDFGVRPDGEPYFTMELLAEESLLDYAARVPIDGAMLASRRTFEALDFVHVRGVVHADLKPSNVLMGAGAEGDLPKLLDFGLATRVGAADATGGTLAYLAPEIVCGRARDHRADLYAMGVVLFRLLTDELPYPARDLAELGAAQAGAVPDPRDRRSDVPPELAEIAVRLLDPVPAARFQRARDVVAALDAWLDRRRRRHRARRGRPPELAGSPRFVGRGALLARMLRAVGQRRDRAGGAIWVVTGSKAMGKTRLLRELQVRAQLERVETFTLELSLAGSPGTALQRLAATLAERAIDGRQRDQLRTVASDALRGAEPEAADGDGGVPAVEQWVALADRIGAALASSSRARRIVLLLDDVDAAPPALLPALCALCTRAAATALIVATATDPEAGATRSFAELHHARLARLRPLSIAHVEQLARSVLGEIEQPDRLAAHVWRETGGNPGAAERFARSLVAGGVLELRQGAWCVAAHVGKLPRCAHDDVVRALARSAVRALDPVARRVAGVAAELGDTFDAALLAAVVGPAEQPADAIEHVLRRLEAAGLLERQSDRPNGFRFVGPALREELADTRRKGARWSRTIVAAIEQRGSQHAPEDASLLLSHLSSAGRAPDALALACSLLRRQEASPLWPAAAQLVAARLRSKRAAPVLPGRWEMMCLVADVARRSGAGAEALAWYRRLARETLGAGGREAASTHALAWRCAGALESELGDARAEASLRKAASCADALGESRAAAEAAYALGHHLVSTGRGTSEALSYTDAALALARHSGDEELAARCLKLRATARWYGGELRAAEVDARAAAASYQASGSDYGAAMALGTLGNVLFRRGRLAGARRAYARAITCARAAGWLSGIGKAENGLGVVTAQQGEWARACEHLEAALAIAQRTGNCLEQALVLNNLGSLNSMRGDDALALARLRRAVRLARGAGVDRGLVRALMSLGEHWLDRGDLARARKVLRKAARGARLTGTLDIEVDAERLHLQLSLALGAAPANVATRARRLLARAQQAQLAVQGLRIRCVLAEALARLGDRPAAEALLHDALDARASTYEQALVVRTGVALAADGLLSLPWPAAIVRDAEKTLRRFGAQPELLRMRAYLQALEGARPGRHRSSCETSSRGSTAPTLQLTKKMRPGPRGRGPGPGLGGVRSTELPRRSGDLGDEEDG